MPVIKEVCTITAKGQSTVPKAIRQALGVGYGDRIAFRVEDGAVSDHVLSEPDADPALAPFLALPERDNAAEPQALTRLTPELAGSCRIMGAGFLPNYLHQSWRSDQQAR